MSDEGDQLDDEVSVQQPLDLEEKVVFEVDRGQPVIMIATFVDALAHGEPDHGVYFSYTQPDSGRPYVDDGYGQARSKIVHLGLGVYRYTFSTDGFPAGEGHMVFKAEWTKPLPDGYDTVVVRRKYVVRKSPGQLP